MFGAHGLHPLELAPILRRKFAGERVLAHLQRPDISRDGPPVAGRNSGGIGIHGSEAAGHHVEVDGRRVSCAARRYETREAG